MKRSAFIFVLMIPVALSFTPIAYACTGVRANTSQGVLVGGNEDYITSYRDVIVRVRPRTWDTYGYIGTGFERQEFFMMGINDQGLFLDMFSVPANNYQWVSDPNKLNYNGFLEEKMLQECANVDEAIDFFNRYNHPSMVQNRYQIFVADASGKSAVISWCHQIEVVESNDDYQVVTNFFLNHTGIGWYPCWRYDTATQMMEDADDYSFELIREVLGSVHLNSNYSQICNLTTGDIFIFYNHNFNEAVHINLNKELKKGRKDYLVADYLAQIELLSPDDRDEIPSVNQLTLEWQGLSGVDYYQLFISTDPNFTNCDPITFFTHSFWGAFGFGIYFLFFNMGLKSLRRKINLVHLIRIIVFVVFIMLFCLCRSASPYQNENSNSGSELQSYQLTVDDLQTGVTYYWKIAARVGKNMFCESKTCTFTLNE